MRNISKPLPPLSEKDIARFWSHVDRRGPDECWPWKGGLHTMGYGKFSVGYRTLFVHRVALFLGSGIDPHPLQACHKCDYKPCCNCAHLFPGTQADNIADMITKGRAAGGEKHGMAKLTAEQVIEIRNIYAAGGIRKSRLAERFGITFTTVADIIRGHHWKHLLVGGA